MSVKRQDLAGAVRRFFETERAFGMTEVPARVVKSSVVAGAKPETLRGLAEEFKDCRLCGLCESRTHVVFGSGNPHAELMFVGEAPGYEEDQRGLPFVGAAGQLLTKIIQAMKLKREDVYIANCLKCRPPNNRSPLPTEIATCSPVLMRQIDVIRPKVICALGKFAAQTLLRTEAPISRLRGRFHEWNGLKVMPTFHPAYLLRNPADKKLVWEDVQQIMRELKLL